MDPDTQELLADLRDLYKQATEERSHYYTGKIIQRSIEAIESYERNLLGRDSFIGSRGLWDEFVAQLPK